MFIWKKGNKYYSFLYLFQTTSALCLFTFVAQYPFSPEWPRLRMCWSTHWNVYTYIREVCLKLICITNSVLSINLCSCYMSFTTAFFCCLNTEVGSDNTNTFFWKVVSKPTSLSTVLAGNPLNQFCYHLMKHTEIKRQ